MTAPLTNMATEILTVLDLLTDPVSGCTLQPLPCRTALYPGGEVPWDSCEIASDGRDGQLWGAVQSVTRAEPAGAGACEGRYEILAEIGVTRCAAKPTDDAQMPTPAEVEADALQQAADGDQVRAALECCAARPESFDDLELLTWTPVNGGGCVGGVWTFRGVWNGCC